MPNTEPDMPEMPNMFKMFLPLGLVYGMKYVDAENPTNIMYMRVFFAVGEVSLLLLWLYVLFAQVQKRDDNRILEVTAAELQPPNPLGDMFSSNKMPKDKKKEKMTYRQHDEGQCKEKIKQIMMQGLIVGGIHWKWGTVLPLVMSVVMALVDLPENPIVRIYLRGHQDTEDKNLKRPFKAKTPFSGFQDAMEKAKKVQEAEDAKTAGETDEDKKAIQGKEEGKKLDKDVTTVGPADNSTAAVQNVTFKGTSGLGFRLFCCETEKGNWHLLGDIEEDGQSDKIGLKIGHNIVSVNGDKCADLGHEEVLNKFATSKAQGDDIVVELQFSEMWSKIVKCARKKHGQLESDDDTAWLKVFTAAEQLYEEHAVELALTANRGGGDTNDDVEEVDISTASGASALKDASADGSESTLEERMNGTCTKVFAQFETNKQKQAMTPQKILYHLLLIYCILSMFLPIKPTDLMKMVSRNTTITAGGAAGGVDDTAGAFAHDEFDDL